MSNNLLKASLKHANSGHTISHITNTNLAKRQRVVFLIGMLNTNNTNNGSKFPINEFLSICIYIKHDKLRLFLSVLELSLQISLPNDTNF